MSAPTSTGGLEISARLLQPFVRVLSQRNYLSSEELNALRGMSLDDRVPIGVAHQMLESIVERTGDVDLGLRAGQVADFGPHEYAVRSAQTVAEALEIASRFMRLLSDALDCQVEIEGDRAIVRLSSKVPLPRASADFHASALQTAYLNRHLAQIPDLEWSFTHERPSDLSEYLVVFPHARLRFSAPYLGYSFKKEYLEARRETGDPRLHAALRKHAETLLAELPKRTNVKETVRAMIAREIETSRPTAAGIAERLDVSQRTLSRRLESEGTSFKELLDDCRRSLALDYVTRPAFRLPEVVFLLGFSETATFYRAFKRWTGQTPLQYRRAQRDGAVGSASNGLTPAR